MGCLVRGVVGAEVEVGGEMKMAVAEPEKKSEVDVVNSSDTGCEEKAFRVL